jgi:hypothetical protein
LDRVFLDANVLFSAAYREQNGLLQFWSLTNTTLLTSAYSVAEARRNLTDPAALLRLDHLVAAVTNRCRTTRSRDASSRRCTAREGCADPPGGDYRKGNSPCDR